MGKFGLNKFAVYTSSLAKCGKGTLLFTWASHCCGFSWCGFQALSAREVLMACAHGAQ